MSKHSLRSALIVAVSLCLLGAAPQKKPYIPSLGEVIEVSIVNVDVVVTRKDGSRARSLSQRDFEIYENGILQPISHFAEYRGGDGVVTVEAAEAASAPHQARTLILFIEKFRLQDFRVKPFIESLKDLVGKSIRKGDSVSIVTYDGRPTTRLSPTDDVAAAGKTLDTIALDFVGARAELTTQLGQQAEMTRSFEAMATAMAATQGMEREPMDADALVTNAARIYALQARVEMSRRVSAINTVLHGMSGVEGKKILVLATRRLGQYAGAEYYYVAGQQNLTVPVGERNELDNRQRIKSIIDNANAAGVTIYPVYPSGLDELPTAPGAADVSRPVLLNEMAMLTQIATETGGLTSYGTTNIAQLLPQVSDDATDYYSLAYRITTSRADRSRKIVVRTKDRALTVRTRREFVERSDDSRMRERVLASSQGLWDDSPVELVAQIGPPQRSGRKTTRPLAVHIPIAALTLVPEGSKHVGAFSVYMMTAVKGEESEVRRQIQGFEISESDMERAMRSYYTFRVDLEVNDDTDRIAVGILDEVSKTYGVANVSLPR